MANLQDTTELVSELTSKLADLDSKVAAYRLDMAAEFTRHSEELLRNVPDNVAYQVSQAISDSLKNFPSLYPPDSLNSTPSHTPVNLEDTNQRLRGSPPPILPHTSISLRDAAIPTQQRGPHERELEFQGLFTPTYLPLLEKVDRPLHSPPTSPATAEAATADRHLSVTNAQGADNSHRRGRPSPLRRATNTSIDSVVSDTSSTKTRKSALRRSSGSSKPPDSPRDLRRVRFDFQGQEVLPSSSPQTVDNALPETNDVREQSTPAQKSYTTSLGDVEGEEDQDQPPKKVSSTQALRALSKAPLDEGTIWTIVNTEGTSESSDAQQLRRNTDNNSSSQTATQEDNMTLNKAFDLPKEEAYVKSQTKEDDSAGFNQPERTEEEVDMDDEDDSDDEATLFMVSKKGLSKKMSLPVSSKAASRKSAAQNQPEATVATPIPIKSVVPDHATATVKNDGVKTSNTADKSDQEPKNLSSKPHAYEEDENEFFEFEDDEEQGRESRKAVRKESEKYLPDFHDDDLEQESKPSVAPTEQARDSENVLPCSPPIDINAKARAVTPEYKVPKKVPRKPEGNRPLSTSIGSFGGRPVTPGVVKDKMLLEKLEKSDAEVPFFVGSVNGRSGPDASNIKSYQASLMSPTTASGGFASGSFAERMMWEKSQGITYDSDGETQKDNGDKIGKGGKKGGD
ncbi:hypothetical protein N0V82_004582 [Gnomoniopsis sp. IMI 355080]|nr:hypothetical protein N0V82_004582 [Gnomoniopsis sp. IMI 355080]